MCRSCGHSWVSHPRQQRLTQVLWDKYAFEGRTLVQLGGEYSRGIKWVKTYLKSYVSPPLSHRIGRVVIITDVTYFGHSWGVLVVLNAATGDVIYYKFLEGTERTIDYEDAIKALVALGYVIIAAVIDGRRGVREMLLGYGIAVQHCQFHQLLTITHCIGQRPKGQHDKELKAIAQRLTHTNKEQFTRCLNTWYIDHGQWLKQRRAGSKKYAHPATRRAYFSLRRNLDYLFTYQDHSVGQGLKIPNTTNKIEGIFGVYKTSLNRHRGCSKELKTKILRSFFAKHRTK